MLVPLQCCRLCVCVCQVCYTALARMAATEGKPDQALAAAREALAAGLHVKLRGFVPALKAYCKAGDVDKAFEVDKTSERSECNACCAQACHGSQISVIAGNRAFACGQNAWSHCGLREAPEDER